MVAGGRDQKRTSMGVSRRVGRDVVDLDRKSKGGSYYDTKTYKYVFQIYMLNTNY